MEAVIHLHREERQPKEADSFADLDRVFELQRQAYRRHPMPGPEERIRHLNRLRQALVEHRDEITRAVDSDFEGRSRDETYLAELFPSIEGIRYATRRIKKWMKPSRRKVGLLFQPGRAGVIYQPLGVVGIIVPWNYPIYLAIGPLTAALAAGNRVMVKMSEAAPRTAEVLKRMLNTIFDEDHVAVFPDREGLGVAFSRKPWDHLLFTGSTAVGRHVMRAAADHLTPVTLELGGKSPAIISPDVPMKDAAERIAFGKVFNAGQTCVAPDYVLCPRNRRDEFLAAFDDAFNAMYPDLENNPHFTSIVNNRQYERLQRLLEDARSKGAREIRINPAGERFAATRKMPISLLLDVTDDMAVMQEEIFGPLLPVVFYDSIKDALAYVNGRPRPLALYLFDYNKERAEHVLAHTHSGGAVVNDTLAHVAQDDLPFGGVGPSGMGEYHGREGFLTFSKAKGVLYKPRFNSTKLIYPPYGRWIHRLIYKLFVR